MHHESLSPAAAPVASAERRHGPVEIDPALLVHVAGGSPKGGWFEPEATAGSPKGGWSETAARSPKGGW